MKGPERRIITGASEGKPERVIKGKPFCHGRQCDRSFYRSRVSFVTELGNIIYRILCFAKEFLERISPLYTFISHTKISVLIVFESGRSTNYIA